MPKEEFRREVEKELTGRDTEPHEIIYFKLYKSQIPVVEQALETAALMLGTDKSRGYCLEMICADFLAGANLDNGNPRLSCSQFCSSSSSCRASRGRRFLNITSLRKHREPLPFRKSRVRLDPIIRETAPAGVATRLLDLPSLWFEEQSSSSSHAFPESVRETIVSKTSLRYAQIVMTRYIDHKA